MRIPVTRTSLTEVLDMRQCDVCGVWNVGECRCRVRPEFRPLLLPEAKFVESEPESFELVPEPSGDFAGWVELGGEG